MTSEKRRKAEILLDSMGDIDDSLLSEALSYRRRRNQLSRMIILAATVSIVFCLMIGVVIGSKFANVNGDPGATEGNANVGILPDKDTSSAPETPKSLDSVFTSLSSKDKYSYVLDPDDLPYLDGNVYIVWKYSADNRYYISDPVSGRDFETIKNALGKGESAGDKSPMLHAKVWILLGDGRVISPYLAASSGNISSEIFDYEVEIVPDEKVVNKIQSILS